MNKPVLSILTVSILLLGACSSNDEKATEENTSLQNVDVTIKTVPEKLEGNQMATVQATVSQGEEAVEDAENVTFEIWKSGSENHEMLEGTHQGEGRYTADTYFPETGSYFVIAHVVARNLHTMPQEEIVVGESPEKK